MSKQLKGIEDLDPRITIVKETASVIPFVLKTIFILGVGYVIYYQFTNRFKNFKEVSSYPNANISMAQAKAKAEIIAGSISTFSNDFDAVRDALTGLNYNAFVRVYNAFGYQTGNFFGGDRDLINWCQNQLTRDQVQQLALLFNGLFFS